MIFLQLVVGFSFYLLTFVSDSSTPLAFVKGYIIIYFLVIKKYISLLCLVFYVLGFNYVTGVSLSLFQHFYLQIWFKSVNSALLSSSDRPGPQVYRWHQSSPKCFAVGKTAWFLLQTGTLDHVRACCTTYPHYLLPISIFLLRIQ